MSLLSLSNNLMYSFRIKAIYCERLIFGGGGGLYSILNQFLLLISSSMLMLLLHIHVYSIGWWIHIWTALGHFKSDSVLKGICLVCPVPPLERWHCPCWGWAGGWWSCPSHSSDTSADRHTCHNTPAPPPCHPKTAHQHTYIQCKKYYHTHL